MREDNIQHLYWRAGFGITPSQKKKLKSKSRSEVLNILFESSSDFEHLNVIELSKKEKLSYDFLKDKKALEEFKKQSLHYLKKYNIIWLKRMATTQNALRERMTLFWANHFVCRDKNILHVQKFNNTLRHYALGDFRSFVKAISKEAAMIKYLNLKQNRKSKPNENFARELMELFTLGMGNYNENDVKESARAFTGYNHNFKGVFKLDKTHVDHGIKTFFGNTGRFNGDDIIDIILSQKQCAKFICEKIYKYFVNEELDEDNVEKMTNVFYENYNIGELMRYVFSADWFYDSRNVGTKIKSPVELLVGIYRTVPFELNNEEDYLKVQHILGQKLLYPPNVSGWKGGKHWIDVNTIMIRLRLPSLLLNEPIIPLNLNNNQRSIIRERLVDKLKRKFPFQSKVNWEPFLNIYSDLDTNEIEASILNTNNTNKLRNRDSKSTKQFCLQLMSLPEYQMC